VFDWLAGMNSTHEPNTSLEVRFKNTRKEFFFNEKGLPLQKGDVISVESNTGFDVGVVSIAGELVKIQMKKKGVTSEGLKKVYRKATQEDIDMWSGAQAMENEAMVKTRRIVSDLGLKMKISDVKFQADKNRATFFYIAEERVDFRELIKVLADTFKVRVEMKQIGSRQEAGLVGGIGSCGRELCCSSWLTDFRSVSTSAARYQQLSINPMKLAGQCGKLKCCLNYELDAYMDALKEFPSAKARLKTKRGTAIHQKSDIFRGMMWYSYEDSPSEFIPMKVDRVREVLRLNEDGKPVDDLKEYSYVTPETSDRDFENVIGQDDVARFDSQSNQFNKKRAKSKGRKKNPNKPKSK
jgi:cell fate regulator YaaT (PSP1 superfamily)